MDSQNLVYDAKTKESLRDFIGFEVDAVFKYVPKIFRDGITDKVPTGKKDENEKEIMKEVITEIPKNLWPVFTLKSKNGLELAEVDDSAGYVSYDNAGKPVVHLQAGKLRVQTLKDGIISVKNLMLENDTRIDYVKKLNKLTIHYPDKEKETTTKNGVKIDYLIKCMAASLQVDLQNAINERSKLTDEELQGLE